jgi:putative membrane protein
MSAIEQSFARRIPIIVEPVFIDVAVIPYKSNIKEKKPMKNLLMLTIALMLPAFAAHAETSKKGDLNDAEIAHIVVTANQVDIDAGNLAKKKASHEDVHAYAHRMVGEHTDVNKEAKDLAAKLNVTPQDNPISKSLKEDGKKNLEKLQGLSGKDFDKAYIDGEVDLHTKVIDVADNKLVPNVKNEELKALLVKVRPTLVSHLDHAKKIQEKLK